MTSRQARGKAGNGEPSDVQEDVALKDSFLPVPATSRVLTLEEPAFQLNEKQRRHVAMVASPDGVRLLINREDVFNPAVLQVREAARLRGLPIAQEEEVSLDVIREVYRAREAKIGVSIRRSALPVQEQFLAMVRDASERRASDIHMMISRFEASVRLRVDGILEPYRILPAEEAHAICVAAFNMAEASDSNYRPLEYQGARISRLRTELPPGVMSVRLQFSPMLQGGRYLVARLLYEGDAAADARNIEDMGFLPVHAGQLARMRRHVYGVNIISGPTGSGKSTTLKRCLEMIHEEKRGRISILTIEDPPEYTIKGAAQFPVLNATSDDDRREKFRLAIVSALRSDPNVMMIGEIRDRASAGLAFEAAMTGHQVWSSLHANNAISILDRLHDLGVERYKLKDETLVTGLISQRLVRRLCRNCSHSFEDALGTSRIGGERLGKFRWIADMGGNVRFANPDGCHECRAGYVGREVIAEIVNPDHVFMSLYADGRKREAIEHWCGDMGGITMLEHGVMKVFAGLCDPLDIEERAGEILPITPERWRVLNR
jgi:type II secretory ATPase GspE/PulE/Tfp pilus assembly ATPase PilB-like protein